MSQSAVTCTTNLKWFPKYITKYNQKHNLEDIAF